jgi:hypothetical protein
MAKKPALGAHCLYTTRLQLCDSKRGCPSQGASDIR